MLEVEHTLNHRRLLSLSLFFFVRHIHTSSGIKIETLEPDCICTPYIYFNGKRIAKFIINLLHDEMLFVVGGKAWDTVSSYFLSLFLILTCRTMRNPCVHTSPIHQIHVSQPCISCNLIRLQQWIKYYAYEKSL